MSEESWIKEKIEQSLRVYPGISPSMLQLNIGSSIPKAMWGPVYQAMIDTGAIRVERCVDEVTVARRAQHFTKLFLSTSND